MSNASRRHKQDQEVTAQSDYDPCQIQQLNLLVRSETTTEKNRKER